MFGRRERDKQELIQFLVALRNEICALREEIARDRQGDTIKSKEIPLSFLYLDIEHESLSTIP